MSLRVESNVHPKSPQVLRGLQGTEGWLVVMDPPRDFRGF